MSATEPQYKVGQNAGIAGPSSRPIVTTTVLIIGAGSTGLALAQGLKQAGISCIVVERDERLDGRSRDWNMGMHWGGAALKSLVTDKTWNRLQSVQVDPSQPTAESDDLKFVNGESGELMFALHVQKFYRLRRSKLRALLAEDVDIRYNMAFKNIALSSGDSRAIVHFNDGSSIAAKLVVGTDGAKSSVRQLLLGPDQATVRRLPFCATFIHSKFTREQALFLREFHPLYIAAIHPGGFFSFLGMQDAADPDRPETWTFFFYISWHSSTDEQDKIANWTDSQRLEQVKGFSRTFTDPFKSAFEWASADCKVWYSSLHDFDPGAVGHRWGNLGGRVTLAGDSAHTMTYQRGQGLNHSLTDAAGLCEAIKKFTSKGSTQAAAISSYEEEMIHRAGGEVRLSTTNTEMLHDWQRVLQSPLMKTGMKQNKGEGST
ncbi:hypothetical protein ACJ72_00827 [Emergomyces africanus]|uniref:FAD-binding domain-containing protein n=1 Tax=Emergomyces africanus TaxID=1955775 RepID=A0A1B7P701_9EURO|nr:hypothetical protein ACJ72_00827 [Emergomyces africanus]